MKKARMNVSHSRFILFKLKIFSEIVTTIKVTYHRNRATRVTKTASVGLAFYGFSSNVDRMFSTVDVLL